MQEGFNRSQSTPTIGPDRGGYGPVGYAEQRFAEDLQAVSSSPFAAVAQIESSAVGDTLEQAHQRIQAANTTGNALLALGVPHAGPQVTAKSTAERLTARAGEIRQQQVEAGVVHPSPKVANRFPVGVTEPNVAGAPLIVTVGSMEAYEALRSGQVKLGPGEELGPPPEFTEEGLLTPESHVEFLGARHAGDKYGATGGYVGTVPAQCADCANAMANSPWIHTNPNRNIR